MKNFIIAFFLFFNFSVYAQQTITHHEIENDVKPSDKMELVYSNTGFPIFDFYVNDKFMLLFSKYAQAFYLLDRKTGLIEDELHLKNIEGLVGGSFSIRIQNQKRKYDTKYEAYLSGYNTMISNSFIRMNDTLIYCGIVKKEKHQFFNFYVSFTKSNRINYLIKDNLPEEKDFVVPDVDYEIKFDRYYHHALIAQYYYPKSKFILLRNSPWERVENKFFSKTIKPGVFIYKKNIKGQYYPVTEFNLAKSGSAKGIMISNDKVIFYHKWSASEILLINKDSIIKVIERPGINYTNQFLTDEKTGKIYLISDVRFMDFNDSAKMQSIGCEKRQMRIYFRQGNYNPLFKAYDLYEFDMNSTNLKHIHHVQITGQIAKFLNENVKEIGNPQSFRMWDGELFLNIPIFSPAEQLGVFKIELDKNCDTTHISTYQKTEYRFIDFNQYSWQSERETMSMVRENEYYDMPGKFAKVLTGKRNYKNKSTTIEELIDTLRNQVQDHPRQLPAQYIAYDRNAIGVIDYHYNTDNLEHAFNVLISTWKQPLSDMLTAIQIADKHVVVEQKGKLCHYTTPDGWHCAFVKIKGSWYLYYQFHKFENYVIENDLPNLPTLD